VVIQPDLGVGEVVIVDERQVGAALTGEIGDNAAITADVHFHPAAPDQGGVRPVVKPDRDAVRPQHGVGRGRLLEDSEFGDGAVVTDLDLRPERVDPRRFQPLLGPGGQVPPRGLLQSGQQVGQCRVAEGMPVEVAPDAGQEVVAADIGDELLEDGGALGVGDPIEVDLDRRDVRDVGRDGMCGGQLILLVGPGLVQLRERRPGRPPAGRLSLSERACPGGERLVQPQVVPPAHGDQVTEPHVRHLVQDRLGPHLAGEVGDPGAEQVVLEERHAARVLHRTGLEFRHEELVILAERVAHAERAVEEVEPLPGDFEDLLRIEVPREGRPAVDAERDTVMLRGDHMKRPRRDGGDVGGHDGRRRELPGGSGARRWHGGIRYWHGGTRYWHGGTRYWHGGTRYWHGGTRYWHGGTRRWRGA